MTFLRRSPAFYVPFTLALLAGLVLSLLPSTPALSDNVPACVGGSSVASTSTARVSLGGQPVAPTGLFQAAIPGQPCAAGTNSASLVSLSRTVIVSPGPANDPAQNGTALLSAMAFISNANPSAANPYLLKVEPGNYSITAPLRLLPYVDLEGSGEDTTTISSTVGNVTDPIIISTLVAASNSEVRFIKIANAGTTKFQVGVFVPDSVINARFSHLTATSAGTFDSFGVLNYGTIDVSNSTFSGSSSNPVNLTNYNLGYGFFNHNKATIVTSTFSGNTVGGLAIGFQDFGYGMTVIGSTFSGFSSGGGGGWGVSTAGSYSRVSSSILSGTTAPSFGVSPCPFSLNGSTFAPLNATCQ